MDNKTKKNTLLTSANVVTIIRILFVPLFVVILISPWPSWIDPSGSLDFVKPWIALGIFLVLSVTDSLDGYLARSKNQITNFGIFMDPLADKILVFAALIALVELHVLPSWVVLIILMREFIVSGIRMLAASKGIVIAASWYGKAKTVSQLIAIILFILKESLASSGAQDIANPLYIIAWIVMIIALLLTIISMADYIKNAVYAFKEQDNAEKNLKDIIKIAKEKHIKIGCAESLTGGKVAQKLTSIPGASQVFAGGIVGYSYDIKNRLLNVDKNHLKNHGAVNEHCALSMAKGALETLECDIAISTTGIAGPDSDEYETPVGTVYIAVATNNNAYLKKYLLKGNREEITNKTVMIAIKEIFSNI